MNCKFCNSGMKSKYLNYIKRCIIYCDNHKPSIVTFKSHPYGDQWVITGNSNYKLIYYNNQTFLKKCHPEAKSPLDYMELIKKFNFEVQILPEEFNSKLKNILTFM